MQRDRHVKHKVFSEQIKQKMNAEQLTQTKTDISIIADYNSMRSSQVLFEEQCQLKRFQTYSEILIKRFTFDNINMPLIEEMTKQLVALAELCFTDKQDGGKRKFNVKTQLQCVLNNTKQTVSEKIADAFLDQTIDKVCKEYSKQELIEFATNIMKLGNKIAKGCLKTCFYED
ncbi:Conserved_hypothetical protein [Hexamita inflata]|uniref:Uncharacterized protein n=1 Tax=Hexamita inflata TaxID=28002 RepID=A0AA86P469_9EUKA|nr:Conserved hypothetical protein [Hexamita inflata]